MEPVTRLFALDQKTGKLLWKHELGEDIAKNLRQYVSAPPLYYKGLVYISVSGGFLAHISRRSVRRAQKLPPARGITDRRHDVWVRLPKMCALGRVHEPQH